MEFESFALARVGAKTIAVWAYRGSTSTPATVYWGSFKHVNNDYEIEPVPRPVHICAPWPGVEANANNDRCELAPVAKWPDGDLRHIADLKIDAAGVVYVAAAVDGGNTGRRFISTVYIAGTFTPAVDGFTFSESPAHKGYLFQFAKYKIEALEFVPGAVGGMAFGTDDEDDGSSIYLDW